MHQTSEIDLAAVNEHLQPATAEERLRWAVDTFGGSAVLLSSMQKSACALMHLFWRTGLDNEILFVDTGHHFRETRTVAASDAWRLTIFL